MSSFFSWVKRPAKNRRANLKSTILYYIREIGLWSNDNLYDVNRWAKFYIVCFIITNITQVIAMYVTKSDPRKLFECFSVLTFCIMGFLKLWSLKNCKDEWRDVINQSSTLEHEQLKENNSPYDYESEGEIDDSFSVHIDSYTTQFITVSSYLARVYRFTAAVFMASPLIEYGIYWYGGLDVPLPHILPGWAPFDNYIIGYTLTVTAEAIAANYCVKVHIAFDVTVVGLMTFIRYQFTLLREYCGRIGGSGKLCDVLKIRDDRAHYRIKQCHHIHVILIKSITRLDNLIQRILGIYFLVTTLTLCTVAVQLSWGQISFTQLISLLQYMGATLTQLFLYCYYGEGISSESSVVLGSGPFSSASWCVSPKIRREIAILCVGMSHQYKMHAGPFNTLDLCSLIQILRAAYSSYAILQQKSA